MIVQHANSGSGDGSVNWGDTDTGSFISRDKRRARWIRYDPQSPMAMAHELGHLLDCRYLDLDAVDRARHTLRGELLGPVRHRDYLHLIRAELRAWRIAKSICRPELWDEAEALGPRGIGSYVRFVALYGNILIDRRKLRIIPLNQGVRLTPPVKSVIDK